MAKEPKKGLFSFGKKADDSTATESEPKKSGGLFSKFRKKDAADGASAPPTEKKKGFFDRFRKKDKAGDADTDETSLAAESNDVMPAEAPVAETALAPAAETPQTADQPVVPAEAEPAKAAAPDPVVEPTPTLSEPVDIAPEPVSPPVADVVAEPEPAQAAVVEPVADETETTSAVASETDAADAEGEETADEADGKPSRFGALFRGRGKKEKPDDEEDGEAPKKKSWLEKLRSGLRDTRASIAGGINKLFLATRQIDEDLLDELEELLISADIGVQTTMDIIEKIRLEVSRKTLKDSEQLKQHLKIQLREILDGLPDRDFNLDHNPTIVLVIGVNGVGKTTTIGKLARMWQMQGKKVTVCAADTFRAAAVDQLQVWADRTGVDIVRKEESSDPAAVVFDALERVKETGSDVLLVDTAGRLHNNPNLMNELAKIRRIIGRNFEDAPHHTLLILDAVTGQNGLHQAKQFADKIGITDLIVTKLDGTAKGGIAIAIAKELALPIQYIGVGEQMDDLITFEKEAFVDSLFDG